MINCIVTIKNILVRLIHFGRLSSYQMAVYLHGVTEPITLLKLIVCSSYFIYIAIYAIYEYELELIFSYKKRSPLSLWCQKDPTVTTCNFKRKYS